MVAFILRRLVVGAGVLLGISIITFLIAFVVPADPAVAMAGAKADPQTLAMIRTQLGLDQPVYVQYAQYVDRALHGDLGRSYIRRESVTALILGRFPATAILAVSAMMAALLLAEVGPLAGALGRIYATTLGFALVYLGEHYAVDLLAGAALAAAVRRLEPRAGPAVGRLGRAVAILGELAHETA